MPISYFQLFDQVMYEMNDPELISVSGDFPRALCEVCLCLLMAQTQAQIVTRDFGFPADLFPGIIDYIPIVDLYEQTPQPDILRPIAVRDSTGRELTQGGADVVRYFDNSWTETVATPTEYYVFASNLLGVRKAPVDNVTLSLTYVPYLEIISIQDQFALDDSYQDRFVSLLRMFLMLRYSQFQAAQREFERFRADL